VNFAYGQIVRSQLPPGFGFLVPRTEGKRVLAVTFVHNKFNNRVPEDRALLRCFLGGTGDEAILEMSEDQIVHLVRQELQDTLGICADPVFTRVHKWENAMAQYNVGHLDRVERIVSLRQQLPGLALAGNAYSGIGVPDCVRTGREAAIQSLLAVGLEPAVPQLTSA
jgi:oxygen-dependent protoporphyrinogen oxidase